MRLENTVLALLCLVTFSGTSCEGQYLDPRSSGLRNQLRGLVPSSFPSTPPSTPPSTAPSTPPSTPPSTSPSSSPVTSTGGGGSPPTCTNTQTLLVGVCVNCRDRIPGCNTCSTGANDVVTCTMCVAGLTPATNGLSCISGPDCGTVITNCQTCAFQNNRVECTQCTGTDSTPNDPTMC